MTGLFPSVFVQILWRRTRCVSLRPFFPFIQSALSISSCFACWHESCFGRLFVSSFTTVVVVESVLAWTAKVKDNVLPTPWQFWDYFFIIMLSGGLSHGVIICWSNMWHDLRHIHQQSFMFHFLVVSCLPFRYFPPMVNFSEEFI